MPAGDRPTQHDPDVPQRPRLQWRIAAALAIGIVAAVFAFITHRDMLRDGIPPDSIVLWRGARILLTGGDPYAAAMWHSAPAGETDALAWKEALEPLYYPMPALLIWLPFALGSFIAGSVAFTAVGAALFAFAISRRGLHRLWLCGSVPFIVGIRFGQWSTWLVAASLLPALSFLLPAKPNLGLALFAARITTSAFFSGAAICLLSLIIAPR